MAKMLRMNGNARDILTDEHGVSIVFAVILVVVLLVIGGILVSTGYANFTRAASDAPNEQNAKTVASAAAFVQGKMDGAAVTAVGGNASQGFASSDAPWIGDLLTPDGGTATLSVQGDGLPANALDDVTVASQPAKGSPAVFSIFVYVPDGNDTASGTVMKFDVTVNYQPSGSGTLSTTTPIRAGDGS